ncbi:hypothetical protein LTR15_000721 [Elasticomyces elasticus]|nr:hypothetical protein LTR15_000721 [Elasticomyces elasticus]
MDALSANYIASLSKPHSVLSRDIPATTNRARLVGNQSTLLTTRWRDLNHDYGDVAESLRSDRLVDIFIGTITADSKPYRVQQVLLESLSDYFTKALRADTFDEGRAGRLQTPDDDGYSWEVLLHWAVHRHMVNGHMLPIDCWIMGDEYQIHAFQNEVMLELLMYYSAITAEYDILEHGIDSTCPRTLVRRLLVEELVEMVYGTKDVNLDELDNLTGVGVVGDILRAKNKHDSNNVAFNACTRFGLEHEGEVGVGPGGTWRDTWREYMVGNHIPWRPWRWSEDLHGWAF